MQLEYTWRSKKTHPERFNHICVIIETHSYSGSKHQDSCTVMFRDGETVKCLRSQIRPVKNKPKRTKKRKTSHPPFDTAVKFHTWTANKDKLKKHAKEINTTVNNLINEFIRRL